MRPQSFSSQFLTTSSLLLLTASHLTIAAPSPQPLPAAHDERGFLDALSGAGGVNITSTAEAIGNDVASLVTDVTSLVQDFIAVVAEIKNVSTENDLVNMLGFAVGDDGVTTAATTTASTTASTTIAAGTAAATNTTQALGVTDAVNSTGTTGTTGTTAAAAGTTTCPGMAVLFARGTSEPGNVGLFAGPSFFTALRNYINGSTSLAVQGVPYAASIPGFLAGGSPTGSALMASFISKTAAACPNTKLVVSGYSQGAQVVHNAMTMLNAASTATTNTTTTTTTATTATNLDSRIMSVVLFGDPLNGTAVAGVTSDRVLSLCNTNDDICAKHGDKITLDHLTYNQNAPQAAMFVMQKSALGLASKDAMNQGMSNVPVVKTPAGANGATQISSGLADMISSGLGS